jgi:hypothetical protein
MNRGRSALFALMLGIAVLALLGWAGWTAMQRAAGMTPKSMSGTSFADAAPGASAELIVEVLSIGADGQIEGRLLEREGGGYRRTSVPVTATLAADTAFAMGAATDVKPRAILQLSGRLDDSIVSASRRWSCLRAM